MTTRPINASFLIRFLALLCFIAALCVAEAWLTKGTWQEWVTGGFVLYTLAEFV